MSEQQSLHEEPGWSHLERNSKELEEKHRIRQLLASHPIGREALLRAGILKVNTPNDKTQESRQPSPGDMETPR